MKYRVLFSVEKGKKCKSSLSTLILTLKALKKTTPSAAANIL